MIYFQYIMSLFSHFHTQCELKKFSILWIVYSDYLYTVPPWMSWNPLQNVLKFKTYLQETLTHLLCNLQSNWKTITYHFYVFLSKNPFFINYANLKYLYLYKLVETFTFLSYFFMRNILSPSSNFYLYFENLSFLTNLLICTPLNE